jgi:GTP-binding protein EngB required for normal cell division
LETLNARALTSQLAEDLAWLEQHCASDAAHTHAAAQLRLAAAVVRNCIGPWLDSQPASPLHIVVVGGAGAGKSTIANLLSGAPAAEANPQAGFTRHPIAYTSSNGALTWSGYLGFLGPLRKLTEPVPSNLDDDVYQVRRVPAESASQQLLKDFVVWDCPDMTTWAATGYIPRLLETAGLADVIVYVASDERYNDEIPTQFLHMLVQSGKPVVVVMTKMREADAPALVAHFQREVLGKLTYPAGGGVFGTLTIPHLSPEQLTDPARTVGRYRVPLLNQVAVLGHPPQTARRRTVANAMRYLVHHQEHLLAVARQDLAALQSWQSLVASGQAEFEGRYNREYLASEKFRGFDEALVRLMELLELPGIGKALSTVLWVVRLPYFGLRKLLGKAMSKPGAAGRPEQPILDESLSAWIDMLRKEAARRAGDHPLWAHVARGFHGDLADKVRERFQQGYRGFQAGLATEVDRTARSIYEELEKRPGVLNTLRGSKLAFDAAAIAGTITAGGIGLQDFILVPIVAGLTHQLVELLGKQVVDSQREQARERQRALMHQYLGAPLGEWLTQWPATGGSAFERLQLALRRIPQAVRDLEARVQAATHGQ